MSFDYSALPLNNLNALYKWCNERYFNNELPKNVPCKWNNRLTRARGRMRYKLNPPYSMSVDLAGSLKDQPDNLLNTMVHEMIHVWQWSNHKKTGDDWYMDVRDLKRHLGMNEGHGPAFFSQMERLNRDFPELSIDIKDDVLANERTVKKVIYGVRMDWVMGNGSKLISLFMLPGKPNTAQRNYLHDRLSGLINAKRIISIDLIQSKHELLSGSIRITQKFDLRKSMSLKGYRESRIKPFLEHESTEVLGPLSPEKTNQVKADKNGIVDLDEAVEALAPYRGMSLVGFAQKFCRVVPYLKNHGDLPTGATLISGQCRRIDPAIAERIKTEWLKASKNDIFMAENVVDCVNRLKHVLKKENHTLSDTNTILDDAWLRAGPRRISREDFAELVEIRAMDMIDPDVLESMKHPLEMFSRARDILMKEKVMAQGFPYLDDSHNRVLGHAVAAAFSSDMAFTDDMRDRIAKVWESPGRQHIQKTKTFRTAMNTWGDMLSTPESDDLRERFESCIAKFGGRVDRKLFSQTVMVAHNEEFPCAFNSPELEERRNMMKSFEKQPDDEGQIAFEF